MTGIISGTSDAAASLKVVQDADREDALMQQVAKRLEKLSKLALLTLLELEARKSEMCVDCAQEYGQLGQVIRKQFLSSEEPTANSSSSSTNSVDERKRAFQERLRGVRAQKKEPSQLETLNTYEAKVEEQGKILKLLIQVLTDMSKENCKCCEDERNATKPGDVTHHLYL